MTISLITPITDPPSRSDPVNFPLRADSFLGALPLFASELNSFATSANELISEINAVNGSIQAAYNNVLALDNVVKWVSGSTYAEGVVVFSPTTYQNFRRTASLPGSSTTDPASDATRWVQLSINATASLTIPGNFTAGTGAGASAAAIELGTGRTVDGTSYIDLTTVAGSDYNFRIVRNTGVNASVDLRQKGSGALVMNTEDGGSIVWQTSNIERMRMLGSNGVLCHGATSVVAGTANTALTISNVDSTSGISMGRFSADAVSSVLYFAKSRGTGHNVQGAVLSGDNLALIQVHGSDGTSAVVAGGMLFKADGTAATGNVGSEFIVSLRNDAGVYSQRFRVRRNGDVMMTVNTTTVALTENNTMTFSLTSNTNLRIHVRGTDGVTRVANLTLA